MKIPKRYPFKLIIVFLSLSFVLFQNFLSNQYLNSEESRKSLRLRLRKDFIQNTQVATDNLNKYVDSNFRNDYGISWPEEIIYKSQFDKNSDKYPIEHLNRIFELSVAFNNHQLSTEYYKNQQILETINMGLDFWFLYGPPNHPNWYIRDIAEPQILARIFLLMEDHLSSELSNKITLRIENALKKIDSSQTASSENILFYLPKPKKNDEIQKVIVRAYDHPSRIGQNAVWIAGIFLNLYSTKYRANTLEVVRAIKFIERQLLISDSEGIKRDFSFHQHGYQLYNASYGQAFLDDQTYWAEKVNGLSFQFSDSSIKNLSGFILDGMQWMIRRDRWDYGPAGRAVSRSTWADIGEESPVRASLKRMISLGTSDQTRFESFEAHLMGKNDKALIGNKLFWRSGYQVHRRQNYFISLKMCSLWTYCHEAGGALGENLQGYHLGQGSMMILKDGHEYDGIYPVWDWSRLPGVTAIQDDSATLIQKVNNHIDPNTNKYDNIGKATVAGGVTNGKYGVSSFSLNHDGITGKKAWFYFDDEVVALGANISGASTSSVVTSINQTLQRGNVTLKDLKQDQVTILNKTGDQGEKIANSTSWIYHDGIGYVLPRGSGEIYLKAFNQTGNSNLITTGGFNMRISIPVMSLWIDHGNSPQNAWYNYILVPGKTLKEIKNYDSSKIEILRNSGSVQAVRQKNIGVTGAIFYDPEILIIHKDLALKVNDTLAVLITELKNNCVELSVANPENRAFTANLQLSGYINKEVKLDLPKGENGRYLGARIKKIVCN